VSQITLKEGASADTPATDKVVLYVKTDGTLFSKDDSGLEISYMNNYEFKFETSKMILMNM